MGVRTWPPLESKCPKCIQGGHGAANVRKKPTLPSMIFTNWLLSTRENAFLNHAWAVMQNTNGCVRIAILSGPYPLAFNVVIGVENVDGVKDPIFPKPTQ